MSDTRDEDARPPYDLRIEPPLAFRFEKFGASNPDFVPLIATMIEDLEWHPKEYPMKSGPLSEARAYHNRFSEHAGAKTPAVITLAARIVPEALRT